MQPRHYPSVNLFGIDEDGPDTIYYPHTVDNAISQLFDEWNNKDDSTCGIEVWTAPATCDVAISDAGVTYSNRLTDAQVQRVERKAKAHGLPAYLECAY